MKYRLGLALFLLLLLLPAACLAAGELTFPDKSVTMYEGEQMQAPLVVQEGLAAEEVKYVSTNRKVAYVDENGMLIAAGKGAANITASLKGEKRTYTAKLKVTVLRQVTGMKLNENGLTLLTPEDGRAFELARNLIANDLYDSLPEEELEKIDRVALLRTGASLTLRVSMEPSGVSDKTFTVFAAQTEIVRVNRTSVKGLKPGASMLQLSSVSNPSVSVLLPVLVIRPVTRVKVTAERTTLSIGEETTAILTYTPEDATLQAVTFKSDREKIASVDENGVITAHAAGQTAIRVITSDGTKRVSYVNVTVVQMPEEVTLDGPSPRILNVGESQQVDAAVSPQNATNKKLTWISSDETVATVSQNGTITAVGQGNCEITAVSQAREQVRASVPVIVVQLVSSLRFVDDSAALRAGQRALLRYEMEPEDVSNPSVVFASSDETVARIDETGVVTALSAGQAELTVTAEDGSGKSGSFHLTVTRRPERVEINEQGPVTLATGRKTQLTAQVFPQDEENRKIAWASTDESVATISVEGIITGKTAGECDILAISQSDPSVMDRVHLIVRQRLTSVAFEEGKMTVRAGSSVQTRVILTPDTVRETELVFTSRDESIARVDASGLITGVSPGRTIIRAQAQDGSGRYGQTTVTVLEAPESLALDVSNLTLAAEQSRTVRASGVTQVTWSSTDEEVAVVDENGQVTAVSQGKCYIVCTPVSAPDLAKRLMVTVWQPVTNITAEPAALSLHEGEQAQISWMVFPGDAKNHEVILTSSDPAVAAVDQKGIVTALSAGECRITLSAADESGVSAQVTVQVSTLRGVLQPGARLAGFSLTDRAPAFSVENTGEIGLTELTLEAECYDIFGQPLACTQGGGHVQTLRWQGAAEPGESVLSDAFTWETAPQSLPLLGRVVLRLTALRAADGLIYRYPASAQPQQEAVTDGYLGSYPDVTEAAMPVKNE